jgi:hypothetical protein
MQFAKANSDLLMLAPSLSFCPALFVSDALSLQLKNKKTKTISDCKRYFRHVKEHMISIQQAGEQPYQEKPEGEHTNSNHQLSARKDFKKLSTCHKFGLLKKNYIAKSLSSRQKSALLQNWQ